MRAFLAAYIQEHRNVAKMSHYKRIEPALLTFESRSYAVIFKHEAHYSKFYGSAWFELTHDYALCAGDRVVFTLDHSVFDLKVETYHAGHMILPSPCCGMFLIYSFLLQYCHRFLLDCGFEVIGRAHV